MLILDPSYLLRVTAMCNSKPSSGSSATVGLVSSNLVHVNVCVLYLASWLRTATRLVACVIWRFEFSLQAPLPSSSSCNHSPPLPLSLIFCDYL